MARIRCPECSGVFHTQRGVLVHRDHVDPEVAQQARLTAQQIRAEADQLSLELDPQLSLAEIIRGIGFAL